MILVVLAFTPKRAAATKAKIIPRVGCLCVNSDRFLRVTFEDVATGTNKKCQLRHGNDNQLLQLSFNMRSFVLGGGCFWCLDAAYRQFRGVEKVVSGYAGGSVANPTYEQVCMGNTGHAEVVEVFFDPTRISAELILDAFFVMHDPTQLNRQGADVGTQYRSAMFFKTDDERQEFESARTRAVEIWGGGIVTEITALEEFWVAEEYHQDFFARNPNQGYCMAVVAPKVFKVRSKFAEFLV